MHLRHTGREQLALKGGPIQLLTHDPVSFRFGYDWTTVMWNMKGGNVENPGKALIHDGMDGDMVLEGPLVKSSYLPLVGPFAEWEISLFDNEHIELDLSGVTAVCMEFHGMSQSAK